MTTTINVHNPGPGTVVVKVLYKPQTHSDDPYVIETRYLGAAKAADFIVHPFQYVKVEEVKGTP